MSQVATIPHQLPITWLLWRKNSDKTKPIRAKSHVWLRYHRQNFLQALMTSLLRFGIMFSKDTVILMRPPSPSTKCALQEKNWTSLSPPWEMVIFSSLVWKRETKTIQLSRLTTRELSKSFLWINSRISTLQRDVLMEMLWYGLLQKLQIAYLKLTT